ncbi:MAG: protein kinase [Candidatus Sumerlaeia bacterium]|nr:protein kinase [Candidatus Sumerlaeia bacterium]
MTGQVVDGKFEILDEIGHGGMGIVYRARQISLDRIVALKMLSASLVDDPEFRNRFCQEAKIIARLSHPNILHVYDILDHGTDFWIVMEYLEGQSLRDVLREAGRLPIAKAVHIAAQVANGLAYAHSKGIIHRDIKPDNIMMLPDDQVKIMDFGIAHLRGSSIHTQTGVAMGTPQFMSPEQAAGKPVDARSDLYSLTVVLYRMLTGELPFTADSPVAVALKHVQEPPPRPSRINPAISPGLDALVLKGLAKKPEERFQSAEEMREALLHPDYRHEAAAAPSAPPEETYVATPAQPMAFSPPPAPAQSIHTASTPVLVPVRRVRFRPLLAAAAAVGLLAVVWVLHVLYGNHPQPDTTLPGNPAAVLPDAKSEGDPKLPRRKAGERASALELLLNSLNEPKPRNPAEAEKRFKEALRLKRDWENSPQLLRNPNLLLCLEPFVDCINFDSSHTLHSVEFIRFLAAATEQQTVGSAFRAQLKETALSQIAKVRRLPDSGEYRAELDKIEARLLLEPPATTSPLSAVRPGMPADARSDDPDMP